MTWSDALGNVSYLLIAVSCLVTNMLWLRTLAMVGLLAETIYFFAAGSGALWVAIGWSLVFLVINGFQLLRLLRESRSARLDGDEELLKADAATLKALLAQEVELRAEFHHALGSDLSAKVVSL